MSKSASFMGLFLRIMLYSGLFLHDSLDNEDYVSRYHGHAARKVLVTLRSVWSQCGLREVHGIFDEGPAGIIEDSTVLAHKFLAAWTSPTRNEPHKSLSHASRLVCPPKKVHNS